MRLAEESLKSLVFELSDDPEVVIEHLEKARRILHEIGEMYSSPGWHYLRQEIEELVQIETSVLMGMEKEKVWEILLEARGIQKVLDLHQGFVETRKSIEEKYRDCVSQLKRKEDDHGEEASGDEAESPDYSGFDFRTDVGAEYD